MLSCRVSCVELRWVAFSFRYHRDCPHWPLYVLDCGVLQWKDTKDTNTSCCQQTVGGKQIKWTQSNLILRVHGWPPNQAAEGKDNFLSPLKHCCACTGLSHVLGWVKNSLRGNRWLIGHSLSYEFPARQNCSFSFFRKKFRIQKPETKSTPISWSSLSIQINIFTEARKCKNKNF